MSTRFKKIFLLLSVVLPFLAYCGYYYGMMIKNAPYKFSEFELIEYQYGPGDSLINQYNSKTGAYQYVNNKDSLIKTKVFLSKDDLLYLHRKAADLGFWNFPERIENNKPSATALHYVVKYQYDRKDKVVYFDSSYSGDMKLKDAFQRLIKEIEQALADAQDRKR
jgi:hypothetical protein